MANYICMVTSVRGRITEELLLVWLTLFSPRSLLGLRKNYFTLASDSSKLNCVREFFLGGGLLYILSNVAYMQHRVYMVANMENSDALVNAVSIY